VPEEKTDRKGNTTRIAQRGGLLWILSGEVYNLPTGLNPWSVTAIKYKWGMF